ncbi:hypothetical protein SAMN05192555_10867 [Franzmannia pantelleriensis]|uniref:MSHA biogenesis protein MshK n=1 Tax=Franzmannia pantelleriensis TaxID=48727 RepID=A0A1G9PD38_9GAMM|nr:hypothetical protein [Halomonas pantelleriensis]SDL96726.1 hypothetical protein SAMN05192555_10867 [Halomonas pantelleriensis]
MRCTQWMVWLLPLAMVWPAISMAGEGEASVSGTSSAVVSSSSSTGGSSRAQSTVSGQNASVTVNGHQLEVSGGRLRLDGVAYGEVTPEQAVTLRVENGVVTLLVDGVERLPDD